MQFFKFLLALFAAAVLFLGCAYHERQAGGYQSPEDVIHPVMSIEPILTMPQPQVTQPVSQ